MKSRAYHTIPTLADTLAEKDTFVQSKDFYTYLKILRKNHLGQDYWLEVEVTGNYDGIDEAGLVHETTEIAPGLAVLADAQIVLCREEIDAVKAGDWHDWIQEGLEADEEAQAEAHERHSEFVREARSHGLI